MGFLDELLKRGYTVFAVVHGSQPKYTIPEILEDINRAVRFIRHHAKDYRVDPDRLGIAGASAGGHLSLMQGTSGDLGNKGAKDPIDRESSRVQAVACYFPPTDFLNYGKPGEITLGDGVLKDFKKQAHNVTCRVIVIVNFQVIRQVWTRLDMVWTSLYKIWTCLDMVWT